MKSDKAAFWRQCLAIKCDCSWLFLNATFNRYFTDNGEFVIYFWKSIALKEFSNVNDDS